MHRRKKEFLSLILCDITVAVLYAMTWPLLISAIHHHFMTYLTLAVYPSLGIGLLMGSILIVAHLVLSAQGKLNHLSFYGVAHYIFVGVSIGIFLSVLLSLGIIYKSFLLIGLCVFVLIDATLLMKYKVTIFNRFLAFLIK